MLQIKICQYFFKWSFSSFFVFPIDEQIVDQEQRNPPDVEIINKEHVEHKVFHCPSRFFPGNDVLIGVLDLIDGAALGDKHLDPVDVVQQFGSFKLWLWNFIENILFVAEY